ncbi:hypothetical protein PGT21_036145 [Puccinia graminis f. sp. tritici]|uniref:Uncharacterized protein n=1 Tax=Puccinia graminis f. sp. tritici TaxID=56615 RepID=A0A5B0SLE8_PUCGR|nr:hypothetical protein PGT21_036145 [Puccinia graminis f. sp. tritici]KAA1138189.1 hypothetical protein PGTUg99_016627 [Puccinia graminis f. sp. tritici]
MTRPPLPPQASHISTKTTITDSEVNFKHLVTFTIGTFITPFDRSPKNQNS